MEVIPDSWNVFTISHRKNKIDPRPPYQRGPTWQLAKKQLLIDTILRNYDMPKIYLRKLPPEADFEHEVADGQQRLRAIWEFMESEYPLGNTSSDLPEFGDLSGLTFEELPEPATDRLGLFKVVIAELRDVTEEEIRDLFLRLQEGDSLNPPEKRNAMLGQMRDFVADLGETHPVFPLTGLPSKRFAWHDLAAIVTSLEIAQGPIDVKAPSLKRMYTERVDFDATGPIADRVRANLTYLARVLRPRPKEMDIKWGFVDLYLALSRLRADRAPIEELAEDFLLMYTAFEQDRRAVSEPAELLGDGRQPADEEMFTYIEAFVRDGGTQRNMAARHSVYRMRIGRDIPSLASFCD